MESSDIYWLIILTIFMTIYCTLENTVMWNIPSIVAEVLPDGALLSVTVTVVR